MQVEVNAEPKKVISLIEKRLAKVPTLEEILKANPELRGFFRMVSRYNLREKALRLISKKI